MRELHYIDGVLLVSEDVCEAVFRYAVALARAGDADMVTIPILWHGRLATANLVVGPSSQLFCTPVSPGSEGGDESELNALALGLEDPELVAELTRRTREIGPSTATASHVRPSDFEADFEHI